MRKTEVQERRFFPERIRRREALVAEFIDNYRVNRRPKLPREDRMGFR